ncbi:MAG: hypothetical protein HYV60_07095, partial [Planctomycetia bacterium]|nr:hypothetical protein [Planctomycetia bacterium]
VDVTFDVIEALNQQTNLKELGWKEDVILGLEPLAEAILSVGQSGVATVEVGVGGKMRGEFELDGDPCVEKSATLDFFARLKATFLVFAAQKTFTFPFLATACSGGAAGEGDSAYLQPRIFTDFDLVPRFVSPLSDPEGETASAGLPAVLYPYAKPALARAADGTMTLVYISEDPSKADGQHLEMFASTWDGAAWSVPVQLTDDTLLDDAPTVAYDANGNAVAMWTRLKNPVADAANTDPTTLRGDMEIVYAVRDVTTQTWSPATPLTNNAIMDFLPQLQADATGNLMAMWLRDDGNDSPIFPDDPTPLSADFIFAQWDGENWSNPAVAVAGVAVNEAPQFALGNVSGLLIWSEDGDRSVVTDSDREIRAATWNGAAWSEPSVLAGTTDGLADLLPRVVYDSQNRAQVTWVKAGVPLSTEENDSADQLLFTQFQGGAFSNPVPALQADAISEPRIIVNADDTFVVWQSYSETGPDIFYAVRDASGGDWSLPIQFTDSPALEWWFNPFVNDDGQLEVLFLEREVGSEPTPDDGSGGEGETNDPIMVPTFMQSRLTTVAQTLGIDLTVLALDLSTPNPSPGSTVQVTVTVRNNGDFTTPTSTLVLRDDGVQVGSELPVPELAAGESVQVVFDWTTPENATAPHTLVAEVDPNQLLAEINETNNAASLPTLLPDLAVESVDTVLDNDTLTIAAAITNQGRSPTAGPFEVRLRQDDADSGTLLGTQTVNGLLAPGGSSMVTFVINNAQATLGGPHTGFVIADSGAVIAENNEANNAGFGALDPRRLAEFALPPSGSPFRVRRDGGSVVVTRQDGTEMLRGRRLQEWRPGSRRWARRHRFHRQRFHVAARWGNAKRILRRRRGSERVELAERQPGVGFDRAGSEPARQHQHD